MKIPFLYTLILKALSTVDAADFDYSSPWVQVSHNVAFQRSDNLRSDEKLKMKMDHAANEAVRRLVNNNKKSANKTFGISPYENGMQNSGTYWSSYQLAWRLLGYYVDCSQKGNQDKKNRHLKKEDEGNGGCTRYVMYAVYVDPEYEGGGIGEYMYYTLDTDEFQCYQGGTCRAKMDCHLPDTNWKMLGIFKINSISQDNGFMEQLFKHEGVCVWGEDTYEFASNMRKNLPNQCKSSKVMDSDGNYLYYAIKPEAQGNITIGLYTDSICSYEYEGSEYDAWTLSGYSEYYFEAFNRALDAYKICQPCVSYDLTEDDFECNDEAGYTNCDQCMKFSAKAGCNVATMDDVKLAARQQGLVAFELFGATYGSGGIGRNVTNLSDEAKKLYSTQLKVDQVTATAEHALSSSTGSFFEKFPYYLEVSVAFFLASLFVFIKALNADRRGYRSDKARALLYHGSDAGTYSEDSDTSSSNDSNCKGNVDRCDSSGYNFFQHNRISATFPDLEPLEDVLYETTTNPVSEGELPKLLSSGTNVSGGTNVSEAQLSTDISKDWASIDSEIGGRGCAAQSTDFADNYIQIQGSIVDSVYAERYSLHNFSSADDRLDDASFHDVPNSKTF